MVYASNGADGVRIARKVFGSEGLTKVVQCILLGVPNPYMWNEDAIRCAHLRREILAELVSRWFGDEMYVARSRGWGWNAQLRSFELRTQLVDGRPAELKHPLRHPSRDDVRWLSCQLLPRLQTKLIESGFDGMVWQAGKGNPVALNNFLLDTTTDPYSPRWAWIDLESGVPALAALRPDALLGFYIPRSWRFRRPLFDDVNVRRLRSYVHTSGVGGQLTHLIDELELRQTRWKSPSRLARSLSYQQARGVLTPAQLEWYRTRPLRWYARQMTGVATWLQANIHEHVSTAIDRLGRVPWRRRLEAAFGFLRSQRRRAELARDYTRKRISTWEQRGQMNEHDAAVLRTHLQTEEAATFATDFCVHIAIKPFVKAFEYWVCPLLYAVGAIGEVSLAAAMLCAGPIARSVYTLGRIVQNTVRGKKKPWTALTVGMMPVLGNFAFPIQIVRSSRGKEDDLARFLVYDGLSRIGARFPIWGGEDTLTEHAFNRLADYFVRSSDVDGGSSSTSSLRTSASALE